MALTAEQRGALEALKQGLAHHDHFGALSDDAVVVMLTDVDQPLFELPYKDGNGVDHQLHLGSLRDILTILDNKE